MEQAKMGNACETQQEHKVGDFLISGVTREFLRLQAAFPSFVYVIQAGEDGPVKIGYAICPSKRLNTLQTASWQDLHLRAVVPAYHRAQAEGVAHTLAAKHNLRGEWFDLTPTEAIGFIVTALHLCGVSPTPIDKLIAGLKVEDRLLRCKPPKSSKYEYRAKLRQKLGMT